MNWNDLSALVAVSRTGTMLGAAKELGVDQTTISRRLRGLEEALGVQLVARHRDGVDLTEAGHRAARSGELVETVVHDLERELVGTDAELAGRLRVTTLDTITQYHPDLFGSFGDRFPSVQLEVEVDSSQRSLARREADLAIRWTPRPDPGLFGRRLARAEFALYASKELRQATGKRPRLSSYPWVGFTAASKAIMVEEFMAKHAPKGRVVCRYDDSLSLHAAIRSGIGIAFMPCAFADPDPDLVRLRAVEPGFGYDIWCLTHPDLRGTRRVRTFMTHAGEFFDARRELYAGKRSRRR